MPDPFVGEIKMFAGNFAPRGFALCDGQLLAVNQNNALFSLLGTTYGGNGRTTFALPDLRGRVPIHEGKGQGLSSRALGSKSGSETETVTVSQLPAHTHMMQGSTGAAADSSPDDNVPATAAGANLYIQSPAAAEIVAMDSDAVVVSSGGNQTHKNIMPFQCINFIIALFGIYPSRN